MYLYEVKHFLWIGVTTFHAKFITIHLWIQLDFNQKSKKREWDCKVRYKQLEAQMLTSPGPGFRCEPYSVRSGNIV